jgi:uncharacterized membrane protein HdeD (DUF308 family)
MAKKIKGDDITAIVSIIAGIIIIALPQIIAWAIGIYLIIIGILKLSKEK